MNILYIGPYRQNDGWGEASKDFAHALLKTGHDVGLRPVYMANTAQQAPPHQSILDAEQHVYRNYDVVIQHTLPTYFDYNGLVPKNVGTFFSETAHLDYTPWPKHCNLMDELWVSSQVEKENLCKSGVTKPIHKVNLPVDVTKFERDYSKIPELDNDRFKFYFVGEYTQRKNVSALVIAFHLEFGIQEPVDLVLKVNKGGMHPEQVRQFVANDINGIKEAFKVYRHPSHYKSEILITNHISDDEMCRLHRSCDCFVMPSHGEAWCRPAADAMGFGNTPIVTSYTGMSEFLNNKTGWLVESMESPALATDRPIDYLYCARETWGTISIPDLRSAMRSAYENRGSSFIKKKQEVGLESVYNFSYDKIAQQINGCLNESN